MFFLTQAQLDALTELHYGRQRRWSGKLVKSLISRGLVKAPAAGAAHDAPLELTDLGRAAGTLSALLDSPPAAAAPPHAAAALASSTT